MNPTTWAAAAHLLQPFLVVFFLPILVVVSIGLMNLVTAVTGLEKMAFEF